VIRILIITLFCSITSYAQNCGVTIDSTSIISNKNLDFFIRKLQSDSFIVRRDKNVIPARIRKIFNCLTQDTLIANPNEAWQAGDNIIIGKGAPPRQKLLFFGWSANVFFIVYKRGGIATINHVMLFRFDNKKILLGISDRNISDFWAGTVWDEDSTIKELAASLRTKENYIDQDDFLQF
jgi:hypothetical protein